MAAIAHGLGYGHIHDLSRDDLVALTPEAAALTRLPYVPEMAREMPTSPNVDRGGEPTSSISSKSETGSANYPKKAFDIIGQMASIRPEDKEAQQEIMEKAMAPRDNPYPEERPSHLDDVVFLSAALTRLVIDPYREACNTRTEISRFKGIGIKDRKTDLPTIDLALPFLFTGFDNAPVMVKKALARALAHTKCAYLGRLPLDGASMGKEGHPWLQLLLPGDTPDFRADALIHVMGESFTPFKVDRLHPNQLVGMAVTNSNLSEALPFALEKGLDTVILDHTHSIGQDVGELTAPMDLTVMRDAIKQLRALRREEEIPLINFGGLRSGTDVAKALAYNCKASVFGIAMAIAMGGQLQEGTKASEAMIEFPAELDEETLYRLAVNWIKGTGQECAIIARCTGKTNIHNLEPEDMRCITLSTSAALDIPMASGATIRRWF